MRLLKNMKISSKKVEWETNVKHDNEDGYEVPSKLIDLKGSAIIDFLILGKTNQKGLEESWLNREALDNWLKPVFLSKDHFLNKDLVEAYISLSIVREICIKVEDYELHTRLNRGVTGLTLTYLKRIRLVNEVVQSIRAVKILLIHLHVRDMIDPIHLSIRLPAC